MSVGMLESESEGAVASLPGWTVTVLRRR